MYVNRPQDISSAEWREIMQFPAVRDAWGIEEIDTPEFFAELVYAVKFHFKSGGPGYVGDLYILHGDSVDETPIVLIREGGGLKSVT
jgi:hypothetical protein